MAGVLTPAQENTVVVPLPASAAPPKVSSALKALLTASKVPREDKPLLEADRILALPTWDPSTFQIDLTDEFKTPNGQQKLRPLQSAALHWLRQVGGLLGPLEVGGGKCISLDAEVYDANAGLRKTAGELAAEAVSASLTAMPTKGSLGLCDGFAFFSGVKPCVRLTLAGGQSLILSTDHPVYTHEGWVEAADLTSQHLVATPRFYPPPKNPLQISDEEVKIVAYLTADGGCTHHVTFTKADPAVLAEFSELVQVLGVDRGHGVKTVARPARNVVHVHGEVYATKATTFAVSGIIDIPRRWGINCPSKDKRLPAEFYGLSDHHVALFLNRLWSCDGHITKQGLVLELLLASEKLIDDVQFLLLRLGIPSRKKYKLAKYQGGTKDAWRLTVRGATNLLLFFDKVGPLFGAKNERSLEKISEARATKANTNVDIVPVGVSEFKTIAWELGLRGKARTELRIRLGVTGEQRVGRDTFRRVMSTYNYQGQYAWLMNSDFYWTCVESVEPQPTQRVVDVSVPDAGNFVAAGILIHNTLVSLLAAVALKAKRPLLLIPPTMQTPLRLMMEKLSDHWKLPQNLYIVPYSQLSVASSTRLLEETIRPDLIICDECQNLRNPDAARSKRFLRYLQSSPDTKIVALSGTMTKRGLRDYAHLAEVALKKKSPLPQTAHELMSWAACLDADGDPRETDWDMFAKFHDVRQIQGEDHFETTKERREAGRAFFQSRLTRTQGVVGSTEESIGANLLFKRRPVDLPDEVLEALENLRATWMRPDEEELVTALDYWRCSTQLAQGFYYYWDWPHGIVDHLWMNARSRWHKVVRRILQDNVADMDSPLLVYRAVERGQIRDPDAQDALEVWKTVKHRKKPPTATKWISDYLIRDAIEWHLDHPSGLIWQSDRAVERAFREAGMVVYGPGEIPLDDGVGKVLSISSHGTGLNLQTQHNENLILCWPSSGSVCEQLFGRTHRFGQTQDEVHVQFYMPTPEAESALNKSRADAQYVFDTMKSPQKLLYGTWLDPEDSR